MEAEDSHNLLSASWRPGKAGGIIQFESQRTRRSWCYTSQSKTDGLRTENLGEEENRCPSLIRKRVSIPPYFCSVWALNQLGDCPHTLVMVELLHSVY